MSIRNKVLFLILFLKYCIFSAQCMAFNDDDCSRFRSKYSGHFNFFPLAEFLSTTQATFSFGECSFLRKPGNTRLEFVKSNYEPLKIDISKGNGERLSAYAKLSLCNDESTAELKKKFKDNYARIFTEQSEVEHTTSYNEMEKVMRENSRIWIGCSVGK